MLRRLFLTRLTRALALLGAAPALARSTAPPSSKPAPTPAPEPLHLHDGRIAGSHYYDCDAVLSRMAVSDELQLRRQPGNPHDARAVEVFWREHKLGYLPRRDNAAAASLLDRGHRLQARVIGIDDADHEWEPVRLRVWVEAATTTQRTET